MLGILLAAALTAPAPADTPTCACDRQCDAMWVEAANALERYTGMRLRTVTDFRLDTFPPRTTGLEATAERTPGENGLTEIRAVFVPRPSSGAAVQLAAEAGRLFNNSVAAAGRRAECPAAAATGQQPTP